jgi:hypothetical protein
MGRPLAHCRGAAATSRLGLHSNVV